MLVYIQGIFTTAYAPHDWSWIVSCDGLGWFLVPLLWKLVTVAYASFSPTTIPTNLKSTEENDIIFV